MNILVLASNVPVTPSMPGSPRLFYFCKLLAKHNRLHLMYLKKTEELSSWFRSEIDGADIFETIEEWPVLSCGNWWDRQWHRIHQVASLVSKYSNPAYHRATADMVKRFLEVSGAALVYVDGLEMMQYLPEDNRLPIILDACDCLSLLVRRQAQNEARLTKRLLLYLESLSLERYEKWAARMATRIAAISSNDAKSFKQNVPTANLAVIPHGIDTEYFRPLDANKCGCRVVFTGVMSYGPNSDAALYFCKSILPLIKERIPGVEVWIIGQNPPSEVQALHDGTSLVVTGTVRDVRPHIAEASVYVCPLRWGTGVKNKILTAMAMKIPVVATSISMEGIEAVAGKDIVIADTAEKFAEEVVNLLENRDRQIQLAESAYNLVKEKYSWKTVATAFVDLVEEVSEVNSQSQLARGTGSLEA
ncbi:MAG: glycosyltransferase [Deltaproteobacteria bacterium]|nr:glycosyltransferase [Deltaproteobacteria bacterium]